MPDITPTYLRTLADGKVLAVFPGGVEILAPVNYPTVTPPNERRVRWVKESDGTLVADITGGDSGFGEAYADFASYSYGNRAHTRLAAFARDGGGNPIRSAYYDVSTYPDPFDPSVGRHVAGVEGLTKLVIQGADSSGAPKSGFHTYGAHVIGPAATIVPPSSTSGTPFVIPPDEIASDWWLEVSGSGFRTAIGSGNLEVYLDGVGVGGSFFLWNEANVHRAIPMGIFRVFGFPNLLPGTHYIWIRTSGFSSNNNNTFTWKLYPGNF